MALRGFEDPKTLKRALDVAKSIVAQARSF